MDPFEEEILHQLKDTNKLPQSESNDEDLSFGNTRNIFSHALPHYPNGASNAATENDD